MYERHLAWKHLMNASGRGLTCAFPEISMHMLLDWFYTFERTVPCWMTYIYDSFVVGGEWKYCTTVVRTKK